MIDLAPYSSFGYPFPRALPELGLMDYNARFYSPSPALGRFLSPDSIIPIQFEGVPAWDRWAYVNNKSLRFVDPTGHCVVGGHEMPDRSLACQWQSGHTSNGSVTPSLPPQLSACPNDIPDPENKSESTRIYPNGLI